MDRNKWYAEMRAICDKLSPWYDIDKIKSYAVYVWTKDGTEGLPYGENVFDIYADEIVFYIIKDHVIPEEAIPIIREIQKKLKEMERGEAKWQS